MDPEQWLKRLISEHDKTRGQLKLFNSYYEGTQPLSYMAPELLAELGDRLRQVVINWPRLIADSIEERLDLQGFRLAGQSSADEDLWRIWQDNDLDEWSQQAHIDALVMGRSYVIVGAGEDEDTPLITVESPLETYACHDPRTRQVSAAYKSWCDEDGDSKVEHATLYLPDETSFWIKKSGSWALDSDYEVDRHEMGTVPVVPIVNRPRIGCMTGSSELVDVIPISDAACKIATDMMISAEFHAMPRRYALGFAPEDFVDELGNKVSSWSKIAGRLWATEQSRTEAEVGQFPEAQLSNFHSTLNQLAQMASSVGALPPHFLGLTTDNPASADAIRSSETRLVKRAERKQRPWSGSWETAQRIADRVRTGEWRPELKRMETLWRDASTPTIAQASDAAVKKRQTGIVPLRQTREDLGYTDVQIARMEAEDAAERRAEAESIGVIGNSGDTPGALDPAAVKAEADTLGVLVRAGVDPKDAADVANLDVSFTGATPVALRPAGQ